MGTIMLVKPMGFNYDETALLVSSLPRPEAISLLETQIEIRRAFASSIHLFAPFKNPNDVVNYDNWGWPILDEKDKLFLDYYVIRYGVDGEFFKINFYTLFSTQEDNTMIINVDGNIPSLVSLTNLIKFVLNGGRYDDI